MKIENEWDWIENEDVGLIAGALIGLSLISVVFFVVSFICVFAVGTAWLAGLGGSLIMPGILISSIFTNKSLKIKTEPAKNLYKKIKGLPSELKANVGELSAADYNAMAGEEINKLNHAIDTMVSEYNANKAEIGTPKITSILHSIEDAAESYRAQTQAYKELT